MNNQVNHEMFTPLHTIRKYTKSMKILLVQDMLTCLNMFQYKNRISSDPGVAEIVLGSPNPDYNKLRITFVSYEQVCIGTTNSTKQRTVVSNERVRYYLMSLATGK